MEQKTTEMADEVISPSQYLIDWMINKKWKLPVNSKVILNCEPFQLEKPENKHEVTDFHNILEADKNKIGIIFFGRLETRKGLDIFLKSLELLTWEQLQLISKITFLGKMVNIHGVDSITYIKNKIDILEKQIHKNIDPTQFKKTQQVNGKEDNITEEYIQLNLNNKINIFTECNRLQAHEYIQNKNTLVVIPSLVENSPYTVYECLLNNINFIASDIGGIPELIKKILMSKFSLNLLLLNYIKRSQTD